MGLFSDDSAAEKAREKRIKDSEKALKDFKSGKSKGSFLSWGGGGRAETKPGLFGLGRRVVQDIEQENSKKGYYGLFGAKHISNKAAEAERRGGSKSWWG